MFLARVTKLFQAINHIPNRLPGETLLCNAPNRDGLTSRAALTQSSNYQVPSVVILIDFFSSSPALFLSHGRRYSSEGRVGKEYSGCSEGAPL